MSLISISLYNTIHNTMQLSIKPFFNPCTLPLYPKKKVSPIEKLDRDTRPCPTPSYEGLPNPEAKKRNVMLRVVCLHSATMMELKEETRGKSVFADRCLVVCSMTSLIVGYLCSPCPLTWLLLVRYRRPKFCFNG